MLGVGHGGGEGAVSVAGGTQPVPHAPVPPPWPPASSSPLDRLSAAPELFGCPGIVLVPRCGHLLLTLQ